MNSGGNLGHDPKELGNPFANEPWTVANHVVDSEMISFFSLFFCLNGNEKIGQGPAVVRVRRLPAE